jgi:hypothetical protein
MKALNRESNVAHRCDSGVGLPLRIDLPKAELMPGCEEEKNNSRHAIEDDGHHMESERDII